MENPNVNSDQNLPPHKSSNLSWVAIVAVNILMVIILYSQGRIWWCKLGDYSPWVSDAWSDHTSQHLFDPYAFTHVLHGVIFFWIINLIFKKWDFSWKLFFAVLVECGWEVLENSRFIIEKYRANTASLDYFGDSIANSLGDVTACAIGFYIAYKLKAWWSLAFFFLVEIILLIWIRDGLIINIVMLIHPIDALKKWQMGV